jgi:hypothetical protein
MNRLHVTMMGSVTVLAVTGAAAAAPPAWCKDAAVESSSLKGLSSKDVREVVIAFVAAECGGTEEADAHHGEVEAARQAWSKRLGMVESDWADAVAYAKTQNDFAIQAELTAKTLSAATPLDQYAVITKASDSLSDIDALYAADMFEPSLTESGRLAFLQTSCLNHNQPVPADAFGITGSEVIWGICQADLEKFDAAKLAAEVHGDTTHDGALKMKLRVAAYELPARMKAHAAEVQQMLQRDDANKKLFETATGARGAWTAAVGKNARLLEVVLAMDSAQLTQSRKQLEGCTETTRAALADAVSTIPARAFAGMHDERDDPSAGFATHAGPVLAESPAVVLAASAVLRCSPDDDISAFLKEVVAYGAPSRGPRNAALAKIKSAKITYDKVGAKLTFPRPRPFGAAYLEGTLQARSTGGGVKAVKRSGDTLTVDLAQTLIRSRDCVASHTGKVARIHSDGRVEHESICDRNEVRTHDHTWNAFTLSARYAAWLKPGVVFSSSGKDVIAIWPNAKANTPSLVLGGAVK